MAPALTEDVVTTMVVAWYEALDRHDELDSVLRFLDENGLEMRFPEVTSYGYPGFIEWYEKVTARFFDETHTVREIKVLSLTEESAELEVVVNWQARMHDGRVANSAWLGFDAYQSWTVVAGENGPLIRTYAVDKFEPMPGSAQL